MATVHQNLSDFSFQGDCSDFKIGISVSKWNSDITSNLLEGAKQALLDAGVVEDNIVIDWSPGTFELPLSCKWLLDQHALDGVIAIGSVIQGETRHFDFVCSSAAQGIMDLNLSSGKPVTFCFF